MNPPGAADPLYVLARRVLLDALDALGSQKGAAILVGAQAIYLHTGPAGLAVAEYTTDADIALDPQFLSAKPLLADALQGAGFRPDRNNVGRWLARRPHEGREVDVMVDLLVPAELGGPGRRGARLGGHGSRVARKAKGLEAALVDHEVRVVPALDPSDHRRDTVAVAGPAALLIAKLHKIGDREGETGRGRDKDALDVLRLLRAKKTDVLADPFRNLLADKVSGGVTRKAVGLLERLFARTDSEGSSVVSRK